MAEKEYRCVVTVVWEHNNHEASSKEEYIHRIKEQFYEAYNLELADSEITEIKEIIYE
jgi:hypothetical protein